MYLFITTLFRIFAQDMLAMNTLNDMVSFLQMRGDRKRVAVVCANDASTRYAVEKGCEMGFIEPVYIDGEDKDECARRAVALCKSGKADILMKGLINTDNLLRAILNKENGILRPGRVLTHIAVAEIPKYEKLLFFTHSVLRNPVSRSSTVRRRSARRPFPIPRIIWILLLRPRRVGSGAVSLMARWT